jgi:WD40 repeat protein
LIQTSVMHIYHSALPFAPKTRLWEMYLARDCAREARVLRGHETRWSLLMRTVRVPNEVAAVEYSHDGNILAVCGSGFSQLFHSSTGERRADLDSGFGKFRSVSFSCDDQILATTPHEEIHLWDIATGSLIAKLGINGTDFSSASFHPYIKHDLVASSWQDCYIRVWNLEDTFHPVEINVQEHFNCICWLRRSGSRCVLIGRESGYIEIWDVESSQRVKVFLPPPAQEPSVQAVASSNDGSLVASGSRGGTLAVYNTETGAITHTFRSEWDVSSVAFSPTEPMLAVGSISATIQCIYLDRDVTIPLKGHRGMARSAVFSPNGQFIASGSMDGTINIWEASITDSSAAHMTHHSERAIDAHFSHDGRLVVSVSWDKTVKIWDACTGTLCTTLNGHNDGVWDAAILSDNVHVVSVDGSGTLILWNWQQEKILCTNKTVNYPQIFPYPCLAGALGFITISTPSGDKYQVDYWRTKPSYMNGPCMSIIASGAVYSSSPVPITQITHRGSTEIQDFNLVIKCDSGKHFLSSWNNSALSLNQLQELHFVEGIEQLPVKHVPPPLIETFSLQSQDHTWILNDRNEPIFWVPPVYRGYCSRWHGQKLLIVGTSGQLNLVDFSNVNM